MFEESYGLLKIGTIKDFDVSNGNMLVSLDYINSIVQSKTSTTVSVKIPYATFYKNGVFAGSLPSVGSQVVLGMGSGGEYFFVSFYGTNENLIPELNDKEFVIQNSDFNKILLSNKNEVVIGSDRAYAHFSHALNNELFELNYDQQLNVTSGTINVNGLIKRDKNNSSIYTNRQTSVLFDKSLVTIGLDPSVTSNFLLQSKSKNPAFVENRSLTYEFDKKVNIESFSIEKSKYNENKEAKKEYKLENRHLNKANCLSLSLEYPNELIEEIKGTVVDTFGNVLDLNRYPISLNKDNITLKNESESEKNKEKVFEELKRKHRKGIAYHFEINARKENNNIDYSDNSNKAKDRSRFFVDIDKEGQFKINIPASSETGNVPVLSRYENYSTFSSEDDNNPNKFIIREDLLDIFHDSFVADGATFSEERKGKKGGSISVNDDGSNRLPIDRITNESLMHGTAHHDILSTCIIHQKSDFLDYQVPGQEIIDIKKISNLKDVVSSSIDTYGSNANGGGRSGQINMDGSLELNIGANTIDKQSMWLDTAGGLVANLGRDKKDNSAVVAMDGNLLLQVGNIGLSYDSRFKSEGLIDAVVDLRVMTKGVFSHLIRIDGDGISIMTPGQLKIFSKQDININSSASIRMDAEQIYFNGRLVDNKDFGQSI